MIPLPITGGCLCGEVRYECDAEPVIMVKCHCRDCQRVSGGPYQPAVVFRQQHFRLTQGTLRHHGTPSDLGGHNQRGFCGTCGSRLTAGENSARGIIVVTASSLDDPTIFAPRHDIYVADAMPWDLMDEKIPKYPGHARR